MLSAIGLFAEGQMPTHSISSWENMTALGCVIVALLWTLTKTLPDLHKQFVEQSKVFGTTLEVQSKSFSEVLDKIHEREHGERVELNKTVSALQVHCAETFGIREKSG